MEYPVGTTSPTTLLEQPSSSSLAMMRGRTDSEDDVPSTMKISSLMYLRNFHRLKPDTRAMIPMPSTMKSRHAM
jgi:hypothetical protein